MNTKILDSILHGELKPWKIDTTNLQHLSTLIKAAKAFQADTKVDLLNKLTALLVDYPTLLSALKEKSNDKTIQLRQLLYAVELPSYKDIITQFYYLLITTESQRYYDETLSQSLKWDDAIDVQYQTSKILKTLTVLTKQTFEELTERNYILSPNEQSDSMHFALYYLKHTLIQLFFSVQEFFKDQLEQTVTIEDFYMLELHEQPSAILPLVLIGERTEPSITKKSKSQKLSFGFHGKKDKLQYVINQLCAQIDLLKEEVSPADILIELLLSKDVKPGSTKIYLDCDNKNFRHVVECCKPYFSSLSYINIEHSKLFYSKGGTLLKANNFSKAKSFDPKEKATIDNIFKQMQ